MGVKHIHAIDLTAGIGREDATDAGLGDCVGVAEPELPQDTLQDLIREAIAPATLPDHAVDRIAELIRNNASSPDVELRSVETGIRLETIRKIFSIFTIREWSIVDWWALHFAVGTEDTDDISRRLAAKMLGITHESFHYRIRNWCDKLNIPPDKYARAEGNRVSWKTGRQGKGRIREARGRRNG